MEVCSDLPAGAAPSELAVRPNLKVLTQISSCHSASKVCAPGRVSSITL
jgi:hypothetical protein